jgi:Rab proteins geranylgeranyltransferase component A
VLISSARLVPQNLVQDTKQLFAIDDSTPNDKTPMARCVAIVDHPIYFPPSTLSSTDHPQSGTSEGEAEPFSSNHQRPEFPLPVPHPLDTGLIVFPPSSVPGGSTTMAATVLVTGEGSMSTPAGKCMLSSFCKHLDRLIKLGILYIALPLSPSTSNISPQQILQPYLHAVLALMVLPSAPVSPSVMPISQNLSPVPLFTTFYIHYPDVSTAAASTNSAADSKPYIIPPPLSPVLPLPDISDAAATYAETVFWEAIRMLRRDGIHPMQASGHTHVDEGVVIEGFWPTVDMREETEDGE